MPIADGLSSLPQCNPKVSLFQMTTADVTDDLNSVHVHRHTKIIREYKRLVDLCMVAAKLAIKLT